MRAHGNEVKRIAIVLTVATVATAAAAYDIHTKALTPVVEMGKPAGDQMKFVENGNLNFVIVGDFGAERTTNTRSKKSIAPAAEFLVEAFEKTTGKRPEVLDARTDAAKIGAAKYWLLIGDSQYARNEAKIDWSKLPRHGYAVKTFPRGMAIVGFDSSLVDGWQMRPMAPELTSPGTEYGALDFCERFLGVRHFFPGEFGSLWPTCENLTISPVHYVDAPYFDVHGNRFHYWRTVSNDKQVEKWRKYMGDGIKMGDISFLRYWRQGASKQLQGSHSPEPISYAAAHKDRIKDIFYTSPSGKFWYNPKGHVGNFYDVTNLKFADLLVEDWKRLFATDGKYSPGKMHEYATDSSVSFGVCDTYMPLAEIVEHPVVKELGLIREEEMKGPNQAAMRNVFGRFFQYLGRSLEKELPGKELWLLIYYNTQYAPNDPRWRLPSNVNIWLCLGDMPRKIPSVARTAKSVALAKEWYEALGGRAPEIMWLYNADQDPVSQAVVPEFAGGIPRAFGKYFGRRGIFFDWGAGVMNLWHNYYSAYALEKAQWNPDFDVDAALDEHWVPFYGSKAGPHMAAFHRKLKDMYLRFAVPTDELVPRYPRPFLDALERELDAARAATEAESVEGRRVRLVADRWPEVFKAQRDRASSEKPLYDVAYVQTADELAKAPGLPLFDPTGAPSEKSPASVRLGWNEKGIYGRLESKCSPRTDVQVNGMPDDTLELFLAPGLKKEICYQLKWDMAGNFTSMSKRYLPVENPPDYTWKAVGNKWKQDSSSEGLSAHFFVPFSAFGDVTAKAYDLWYGNVVFTARGEAPAVVRGSSLTLGDVHDVNMYGYFRLAGRGDTLPRTKSAKVIEVGNSMNNYRLTARNVNPRGTDRGELRLTLGNEMNAGFAGIVSWLKLEVNGIQSRDLVIQDGASDSYLFNFDGAKVRLTPYMDKDSPLLKCVLEPVGGIPVKSCKVCLTSVPSKLGKKDGKVMFSGNRRKIVSPRTGAWLMLDEENDGSSEERGWGPSCVFADMTVVTDVRKEAGSSWVASLTFTLKPDFRTFRFGVYERNCVRQTNDDAVRFVRTHGL